MGTWVGSVALRLAEIATVEAANPLSEGAVPARLQCPLRGAGGRGGSAFIPYAAGRPLGDILCIQESRSGGRRLCKVPNTRSMRPRASGE